MKTCPNCGASVETIKTIISEPYLAGGVAYRDQELPRRERPATIEACTACEYAKEAR